MKLTEPLGDHRAKSRRASVRFAVTGCRHIFVTQPNARIHAIFTIAVVATGIWLGLARIEWAILVLTMGLVWVAEFVNTTLEAVVDLASPGWHPLAKSAKDVAAGAVLLSALTAAIVGFLILGPPLWAWIAAAVGST